MKTEKSEDWGEELSVADGDEAGKGNGDEELMNTKWCRVSLRWSLQAFSQLEHESRAQALILTTLLFIDKAPHFTDFKLQT